MEVQGVNISLKCFLKNQYLVNFSINKFYFTRLCPIFKRKKRETYEKLLSQHI